MNYKELKGFDLNSIQSNDEGEEFVRELLDSDEEDILKYINYLLWSKYNYASIDYMKKIQTILSIDEISKLKKENSDRVNGSVEDLESVQNDTDIYSEMIRISTEHIKIDDKVFSTKAILEDDFEEIVIVKDSEGTLFKYGIMVSELGEYFAYELLEEKQEYYQSIIDAKIGTKINVFSAFCGVENVTKTFKKVSKSKIDNNTFTLTKKTSKGVLSPMIEGVYTILKSEEVLSNDGVSEDLVSNEVAGIKQDIAKKLGIELSKFEEKYQEPEEEEFSKTHFDGGFQFSEKRCFSIETPDDDYYYNSLTQTVLIFNGSEYKDGDFDGYLVASDEYVDEVYQLLYTKFGISEEMEGYWVIDNSKLESVLRTIVRAGGEIRSVGTNASMFLQRFLRLEKLERILKTSRNFHIVKEMTDKEQVEEFVKDAGTEMYFQLGQVITSILEGTQRLFGEGHVVFDSDYKITICQIEKIDLVSASEYAIDNGYKKFYIINKSDYKEYDAWYKETIVLDEELPIDFSDTKETNIDEDDEKLNFKIIGNEDINAPIEEEIIYESDKPIDIVIVGTEYGGSHDFEIYDDYASYQLTKEGKRQTEYSIDCDGFVSVIDASTFFTAGEDKIEGFREQGENVTELVGGVEFYMIHNFVGQLILKVSVDGKYVDTTQLMDNYIYHQIDTDKDIEIELDFKDGEVIEIDNSNYEDLKNYYLRESKLKRINKNR